MFDCRLYNVFRKDRCSSTTGLSKGGGVLVAVRASFPSTQIELSSDVNSEQRNYDIDQIIIKILVDKSQEIFISASYIPPLSPVEVYKAHINNCCTILSNRSDSQNVIIVGDFNLPNVKWSYDSDINQLIPYQVSSESECEVLDTCAEFNLNQINDVYNENNRLLDLIFVDNHLQSDVVPLSSPPLPNSIHHKALCVSFRFINYIKPITNIYDDYNFSKAEFDTISHSLDSVNWESALKMPQLSQDYDFFRDKLKSVVDKFIPKNP